MLKRIGLLLKMQLAQSGQVICQWKGHAKRRKKNPIEPLGFSQPFGR